MEKKLKFEELEAIKNILVREGHYELASRVREIQREAYTTFETTEDAEFEILQPPQLPHNPATP